MTIIPMAMGLDRRLGDQVGSAVLQEASVDLAPDQADQADQAVDRADQEVDLGMVHPAVMEAGVVGIVETSNVKVLVGTMTENPNGLDISGS
jgi:hypothetical protein